MSSDPRAVDNSLRWIADEQKIHETTDFGENKKSVEENLADQKQRITLVKNYKGDVDKLKKVKDGAKVEEKYKTLDAVATSRLECLEGVSKVAGLEDLVNKLSSEFSIRASQLVESPKEHEGDACDGIGAATQNCILAVRANWSWISKLVHCTDIHLKNASDFHQFFHTAKEYERWMASDLQKAQEKVLQQEEVSGNQKEASKLLLELKEILSTFLHWQGKIDSLFDSSKNVVPVQLRTKPLDHYRPVTALCNYKTKEINVREGEEMTLTDNSNPEVWKVRTLSFDESDVPSVICLIPGPDADAVHLANKLRLQLLGIWTLNVKRIGKTLIWFMLLTVKKFDDNESKKLKAIPKADKNEIGRMLAFIETTLGERWNEYDGYKELECRNTNMRRILSAQGNKKDHDPKMAGDLKLKLEMVEELLKKYKDFWDYWETYKCLVETSNNPEYLLIVDAWQQLKFLELAQLRKQWPKGLKMEFTDEDNVAFSEWLSRHGGCIHDRYDKVDGEGKDHSHVSCTYESDVTDSLSASGSTTTTRSEETVTETAIPMTKSKQEVKSKGMMSVGPVTEMTSTGSVTTTTKETVTKTTLPVRESKEELETITTKEMTSGGSVTEMSSGGSVTGTMSVGSAAEMISGEYDTERTSGGTVTTTTEETITRSVMPAKQSTQESRTVAAKKITSGGSEKEKTSSGPATEVASRGSVTTATKETITTTTMPTKTSKQETETITAREIISGGSVTKIISGGSTTETISGGSSIEMMSDESVTERVSGGSATTTIEETITRSAMPIKESRQESKTITTKEIISGGQVAEKTSGGPTTEISSSGSVTQITSSATGGSVRSTDVASSGSVTTTTEETITKTRMPIKESKQESEIITTRGMASDSSVTEMISGGSTVTETASGDFLPSTERTETIMRTTTKPTKGSMQESKTITTTKTTSGGPVAEMTSGETVQSTEKIKKTTVSSVTEMKSGGSLHETISGSSVKSTEMTSGGSFESQSRDSRHFDEKEVVMVKEPSQKLKSTSDMLYGEPQKGSKSQTEKVETAIVEESQKLKSTTDMLYGTDSGKEQGGSSSVTETIETVTTTTNLGSAAGGAEGGSAGAGSAAAGGSSESWSTEEVMETVESVSTETLQSSYANGYSTAETTMSKQYETAETEQVSHMEQEEKKTFVITGVFDPTSNEEVSMQKAVMLGIINSANGTYNNLKTGESIPIPAAMNAGLIKVEFTSTKRTEEKRRDIGLITIKTHKESRPYTVKAVIDAATDKHLSIDEAISKGILDQAKGNYHNTLTDTDMSLADALDTGLLVVEFDDTVDVGEPEIVTKTYAIHAVVDQKARKKISFTEAVRKNLLDRETGAYHHNVNNEDIYVGDAIRRGFIKATIVADPSSLNIDPENKMVVEKVDSIKRRMLAPMKALSAMKKAADASGK